MRSEAARDFTKLLDRAIARLVRELGKRNREGLADSVLRRFARLRRSAENSLLIARRALERGNEEEAVDVLREARERYRSSSEVAYRLGFALERSGAYEQALKAYNDSIELRAPSPELLYRVGRCLAEIGRDAEAAVAYARALEAEPQSARVHRALLDASRKAPLWRRYEILRAGSAALAEDAGWQRALVDACIVLERWQEGANAGEALLVCKASTLRDASKLVLCYIKAGDVKGTERALKEVVQRDKRNVPKVVKEGAALERLDRWTEAAMLYVRLHQREPSATTALRAGIAMVKDCDWVRAAEYLRMALVLEPNNWDAAYYLGLAEERAGNMDAAVAAYRLSAPKGKPNSYRFYRWLRALVLSKRFEEAAEALRAALSVNDKVRVGLRESTARNEGSRDALHGPWTAEQLARLQADARVTNNRAALRRFVEMYREDRDVRALAYMNEILERAVSHNASDYLEATRLHLEFGEDASALEMYLQSRLLGRPYIVDTSSWLENEVKRREAYYIECREDRPLREHVTLYESNLGAALTCNVLALLRYRLSADSQNREAHVVAVASRDLLPRDLADDPRIIIAPRNSDLYVRTLATAGRVVSNNTFPTYFTRRDGQKYLNMWHGTPIKSMGRDIKSGEMDYRNAARNLLQVTHLAVPNAHAESLLLDRYCVRPSFTGATRITGSPRLDAGITSRNAVRERVRELLDVDPNQRLIAYVPTWRGDLRTVEVEPIDVERVLAALAAPGRVVLYRGHPVTSSSGAVRVAEVRPDVDSNELIVAADLVVTDYSSIGIDALAVGTPTLLFAPDRAQYALSRGFSLDIDEIGAPVAETLTELEDYADALLDGRLRSFDRLGLNRGEDGQATERVSDFLDEEHVPIELDSRTVLTFQGHFVPNGITASALEFDRVATSDGARVSVAVQPREVLSCAERVAKFESLPKSVEVLPAVGTHLTDPEEAWLVARLRKGHPLMNDVQREAIHRAFGREFRRLFGAGRFGSIVFFEGYAQYWAHLLAAGAANQKIAFLHNEMAAERRMRTPHLRSVFESYRYYDKLVSVSESVGDANRRALSRFAPNGRFSVLPNSVDFSLMRMRAEGPIPVAHQEFIDRFEHIFICVGRVSKEKGQDRLVEAFRRIVDAGANAGLVLVGDGPLMPDVALAIALAGLEDRVLVAGYQENPYPYFARSDTFVLPSRHEGQGIVVLEALALGCNAVSVDIPGPRSVLSSGYGRLVEPSVHGLSAGMLEAVSGLAGAVAFDFGDYERSYRRELTRLLSSPGSRR